VNCETGLLHALRRTLRRLFFGMILPILMVCAVSGMVRAESVPDLAREFFPQADRIGEFEGDPLAAPVYRDGELLGYVLRTTDVVRIPAYSGEPITLLVGFNLAGSITGVEITRHAEPILVVGVSEQDLKHYADQYRGVSVLGKVKIGGAPREGYVTIDGITGATITAMVMNATVMRAVQKVAESRGVPVPITGPAGGHEAGIHDTSGMAGGQPAPLWWLGAGSEPFWVSVWRERGWQIAVLLVALLVLTLILLFQDWLTRRPNLLTYLRTAYLVFTLFFIGWYTLAQLSVIHVLTFINAILHQFSWEAFLSIR